MSTINVTAEDIKAADAFLTAYLSAKIPDAEFTEGGAVRDFVVKAMAYIVAFLSQEEKRIRDHQSLLKLVAMPESADVDQAVDALLANWFLTRKGGSKARVPATLHFSKAADIVLEPTTRFFKGALAYSPDVPSTWVVPASELKPAVTLNGASTYTLNLTLVCQSEGKEGNVSPGRFSGADTFSPFFLYAENTVEGYDGLDQETTQELLERAPTAISVRNLINARSIGTVLPEKFKYARQLLTVGFNEPEMTRDWVSERSTLGFHTGGHTDIYVSLPRSEVTETLVVGASVARGDGVINVLRDATADFNAAGVQPGHVLRVSSGLPGATELTPLEYIITGVAQHHLEVHVRGAFPLATDETSTVIGYSVGYLAPSYDNVVAARTGGYTSRKIEKSGSVFLAPRPRYRVKHVELQDGGVQRVYGNPVNRPPTPGSLQYQLVEHVPENAQSRKCVTELVLADGTGHNGKSLKVTYETLVGYEDLQNYVTDEFERVLCSDTLVKGYHPVYVGGSFKLRRKNGAKTSLDLEAIKKSLATFINEFDTKNVIDAAALRRHIGNAFPDVGLIYEPFIVDYHLLAPDGQTYTYDTRDVVTLFPRHPDNGARLLGGTALREPLYNAGLDLVVHPSSAAAFNADCVLLRAQLEKLGVSDRTVRYLSDASYFSLIEVL